MSGAYHVTSAPSLFYAMECSAVIKQLQIFEKCYYLYDLEIIICKSYLHISREIILKNKAMMNTELPPTFSSVKKARLTELG